MKTMKTMTKRLLFIAYGVAMIVMSTGCSKDNPVNQAGNCYDGNWAEQFSDELQAYSSAISSYSENPTTGNCSDYKNAAKAYLDALNEVYDCVPTASISGIDQAIEEAKASIDSEDCD